MIRIANLEPDGEVRQHLQAITRAFKASRQHKRDAPVSLRIELKQEIKILLSDGSIEAPRSELELALTEIDPPAKVGLIRECPVCQEIFWAARFDKEACARHAERWRKQEQRRRYKERKEKRAKARARRAVSKRRIERPLSRTSMLILEAIANQLHLFKTIDEYVYWRMHVSRWVKSTDPLYRTATVIRCLKLLADSGYIGRTEIEAAEETEKEHKRFYYTLQNKARVLFKRIKP